MVEFLEAAVVPLRLGCHHPGGGLWQVALWYRYRDGRFECATGADADIVRFLRRDGAVSFDVSTNRPPYMGVRGSGTATVAVDEDKTVVRSLVERYLGDTDSRMARWLLADEREEVRVTVDPDRLYTWDFSARMAELDDTPAGRWEP
jgi:nitroimidazol reductase NimA-like FMN-containing flavoprotein (pyridoxamine 5'-phosphate oxidase superfamily)